MIKNILVPIDFSAVSLNALNYAKGIAKVFNSTIVLFHSSHLIMVSNEMVELVYSDMVEDESIVDSKLNAMLLDIKKDGVACDKKVMCGLLADDIKRAVAAFDIDMIVSGTSGTKGVEGLFFGTNSSTMFENVHCPVLIIPKNVLFRTPKKIMYATDFKKGDSVKMKKIGAFAQAFESEVLIAHINKDVDLFEEDDFRLDRIADMNAAEIAYHNISYKLIYNEDVFEGLNKLITSENVQMICMSRSEKSFFQKLFSISNTKEMAYRTRVPLLVFCLEPKF